MKRIYSSNHGQTIFDVALQMYGSLAGIAWLLEDNPDLILASGEIKQFGIEHKVRDEVIDQRLQELMQTQIPTTGKEKSEGLAVVISDDFGNVLTDDFGNVISAD